MMRDRLFFLTRIDSPIAEQESVMLSRLSGADFAILPHFNSSENALVYVGHMTQNNTYTVYPSVGHIKRAVREENMVAILSGYALGDISALEKSGLVVRPIGGLSSLCDMTLCLLYQSKEGMSDTERKVVDSIRNIFKSITDAPPIS